MLPCCILRLGHIVGPGKTFGANTIIMKLMNNQPPILFGDGSTINDFTSVADVVQAIINSIDLSATGTYNIGSGTGRTAKDFTDICRKVLKKEEIEPIHMPPRGVDFDFEYNISKATSKLNYEPSHTLEKMLEWTIEDWAEWL